MTSWGRRSRRGPRDIFMNGRNSPTRCAVESPLPGHSMALIHSFSLLECQCRHQQAGRRILCNGTSAFPVVCPDPKLAALRLRGVFLALGPCHFPESGLVLCGPPERGAELLQPVLRQRTGRFSRSAHVTKREPRISAALLVFSETCSCPLLDGSVYVFEFLF